MRGRDNVGGQSERTRFHPGTGTTTWDRGIIAAYWCPHQRISAGLTLVTRFPGRLLQSLFSYTAVSSFPRFLVPTALSHIYVSAVFATLNLLFTPRRRYRVTLRPHANLPAHTNEQTSLSIQEPWLCTTPAELLRRAASERKRTCEHKCHYERSHVGTPT